MNNIELVLSGYTSLEENGNRSEYIDMLESVIIECNKSVQEGVELVSDSVYDTLMDYLKELNPNSPLLHTVWSIDDESVEYSEELDKYLGIVPMLSIQTVKDLNGSAVKKFKGKLFDYPINVIASIKENGHAWRLVWDNGKLVKATSRGRSTNGRDVTRQAIAILGKEKEEFKGRGIVEGRCEVLLPIPKLEDAREFNPKIKSAFSGVASLIRESTSDEELKLLSLVFYDIMGDYLTFENLSDKYEYLDSIGLETPLAIMDTVEAYSLESDLERIVNKMDDLSKDYPYYTDGVVVSIDNIDLFNKFGSEDKFRLGNLALKVGRWKQDSYSGVIKEILWEEGKSKKTPVALIEETMTATGNTVSRVPLYAPNNILLLSAYPGKVIHFRYGGESGVIPTTPDGKLLTDKTIDWDLYLSEDYLNKLKDYVDNI